MVVVLAMAGLTCQKPTSIERLEPTVALPARALMIRPEWFRLGALVLIDMINDTEITIDTGLCMGPVFSPDGKRVAYSKQDEIYIAGCNGSNPRSTGVP